MDIESNNEFCMSPESIEFYSHIFLVSEGRYNDKTNKLIYKEFLKALNYLIKNIDKYIKSNSTTIAIAKIAYFIFLNNDNAFLLEQYIVNIEKISSEYIDQKEMFILMKDYLNYIIEFDKKKELLNLYIHFVALEQLYFNSKMKINLENRKLQLANNGIEYVPKENLEVEQNQNYKVKIYKNYIEEELKKNI